MKILNLFIASLMVQSPVSLVFASPVNDVVGRFTSKLTVKKTRALEAKNMHSAKAQYCLLDDLSVSKIEDGVLRAVKKNILALNTVELAKLNFEKISGLTAVESSPVRKMDGISEFNWTEEKTTGSFAKRLAGFSSVEFAELKVVDYMVNPADHVNEVVTKATLKVRLDIRGIDKSSHKMQDRLELSVAVAGNPAKIEKIDVLKALTLVQNLSPAFEDVTAQTGLDKVSVNLRTEALRRGGYALAVTDYNADGVTDIFVGHRENAEMFVGSKDGKFSKVSTPLDGERYSKTAVFADFSNSGKRDVVINRFIATDPKGKKLTHQTLETQVAFYKNVDGKLVEQGNKFGDASTFKKPMPAAVADFNGDGLNDVYIGYPGVQDFSQFGEPTKSMLKFQGLYMNDGKGGFTDTTEKLYYSDKAAYNAHLFPHSSLAVDLNQDQKMDLVVLDDRGNLSPAFINAGGGNFKESSKAIGISNFSYAMGISSGDINNDGLVDIGMTNVNFNEVKRLNSSCMTQRAQALFRYDINGFRLFSAKKDGVFNELPSEIFDNAGEAMGGLTFIDYNNDGHLDVYLVNGLWSGTSDGQELGAFFASAMIVSKTPAYYNLSESNDLRFMDVLQSFSGRIGDYTKKSSIIPGKERPSLAGFQRNRLFRNNGDGTFTDVAFLEGVDSIADGYIVGKMDYNGDGQMDLILRNADPGTKENQFPAVQLFKNKNLNAEKSVVLTFEGTKLSREALGLYVKAYGKDWQQVAHLEGNSGSMQQQHLIHFGLGKLSELEKIEVYWPSGVKQTLRNIGPGYHHIIEPKDGLAKD